MSGKHIVSGGAGLRAADCEGAAARCPLCFSRRFRPVEAFHRDAAEEPWRVVACRDCRLMYTDPRPAADDWERLYPADYPPYRPKNRQARWHTRLRAVLDRWLLHLYRGYPAPRGLGRRRPLLATVLSPVLGPMLDPYLPPVHGKQTLLDVGCGCGAYLARMRSLGWDVLGIDRNSRTADLARRRFGVPVKVASFPCDAVPRGEFDLVTAWQVLEHLERPRQALGLMRDSLRPGGRLMLTVPNQQGWAARHFGPDWIGLDLPRHLTHFTPRSLGAMLQAEGFAIVHRTTLGHSGWIRHSARRSKAHGRSLARRVFVSKLTSRAASAAAVRRGAGESIFVVAEPIR